MDYEITTQGDWSSTSEWLSRLARQEMFKALAGHGARGVAALAAATPVDSGVSAGSWSYEVRIDNKGATVQWTNSNVAGRAPLVIMLTYGHATGTGGWVAGRDFINPAIQPIMDQIANDVWKEMQ